MAKMTNDKMSLPDKMSFSIEDLIEATSANRTSLFAEIKAGRLKARKLGRRTIVLRQDAEAWLQSLPYKDIAPIS